MSYSLFTIPNLLSLFRILLAPVLFWALKQRDMTLIIIVGAYIVISDFLDGMLARKLDSVSELGKVLDPLGDKIATALVAIAMVLYYNFPAYLMIMLILRDLLILIGAVFVRKYIKEVPASNIIGKATAVVIALCFILHLTIGSYVVKRIFYTITATFVGLSFASYVLKAWTIVSKKRSS